jgi:propanol-preferring alcohol dehydrogenase
MALAVEQRSHGQGADVVVELAGVSATLRAGVEVLGRRGCLVLVGYSSAPLIVSPLALVVAEQRILTSLGNTQPELAAAVALAAAGLLTVPVADTLALREVNTALDHLRAGTVTGRLVLEP